MIQRIFILIIMVASLASCQNAKVKRKLLPGVSGKAGEVLIIMDKELWQGENGKTIRSLLTQDTPGLPQSEPIFNPMNLPRKAFTELFRIHRNLLITQINPEIQSPSIKIDYDVWAQPQLVIKLSAKNSQELLQTINDNKDKIVGVLFKAERDRLMKNYKKYKEQNIISKLETSKKVHLTIPKGYTYDLDTNNFAWISHETPEISQGIFVYTYPFTSDSTFTLNYQIKKRNKILKLYVSGEDAGTYMTTEDQITPSYKAYDWKGVYTSEIRGLWKVQGDFMGGPFVSLTRINEKTNEVVTVEGYVFAPKYDKRNYMRQLEAILYSLKTVD